MNKLMVDEHKHKREVCREWKQKKVARDLVNRKRN